MEVFRKKIRKRVVTFLEKWELNEIVQVRFLKGDAQGDFLRKIGEF